MLETPNPKIEESLTPFLRVDACPAYLKRAWLFAHGKGSAVPSRLNIAAHRAVVRFQKGTLDMAKKRTNRARRSEPRIYRTPPHPMAWAITGNQVYPINDLRKHSLHDCWCRPVDDDGVMVHKSLDQRELYETGERQLS